MSIQTALDRHILAILPAFAAQHGITLDEIRNALNAAHDVTDAIMAEAADDSNDCSSYDAQRTEAKMAGHYA